jgi:hypothetical protein
MNLFLANSVFAVISVQDELSQSFDFPIFKRCNQVETGRFKGERVSLTRRAIARSYSLA